MKRLTITVLALFLTLSLAGCAGGTEGTDVAVSPATSAESSHDGTDADTPDFHYTKDLYSYDHKLNDYQGGYQLVEGLPWEGYPADLPLIGGYMDLSLGGGPSTSDSDSHSLVVFTRGGDDGEIANWYRQQLESAGWEVTDFETSEQYGSTMFKFSNDNWYGDFLVQSEESALGGYDGAMPRDESDFEKTAVIVNVNKKSS